MPQAETGNQFDTMPRTVGGGLNRYLDAAAGFQHFRHDPGNPTSLSADAVTALHQDRHGRLWVGTWTAPES